MRFADLPLREQKHARTRVGLVDALIERLAARPLADIPAAELAAAVGISQATFFNHFPSKDHLLGGFIQLWSVEVAALSRRISAESDSALAAIEALFEFTAAAITPRPQVMLEIVALQARMPANYVLPAVPRGDRLLRLPDEPDVMALSD